MLDSHLNEAPTEALETFNQITNIFFDTAILSLES